jgi:hypothetical protein
MSPEVEIFIWGIVVFMPMLFFTAIAASLVFMVLLRSIRGVDRLREQQESHDFRRIGVRTNRRR